MAKKVIAKGSQVKGNDVKSVPQKGQKHQEINDDEDDEDFDGSDDGYDDDHLNENKDEDEDEEDDSSDDDDEDEDEDSNEDENEDNDEDDDDEFEVQSGESSNSDSDEADDEDSDDEDSDEEDINDENAAEQKAIIRKAEASIRHFREANVVKNVIKATTGASKKKPSATMSNNNDDNNNNNSNTSVATSAPSTTDLTSLLNTDDVSSDEEDRVDQDHINTIGRVPLHWYDAYDHIGYTINGQKLFKKGITAGNNIGADGSGSETRDRIDQAIENRDNPNSLNTVYDMYNDREVMLSARDLEIISRLQAGTYAHPEHNDMPDYVDYFSSIKEIMPLSARPLAKQSFVPSKWELLKVKKILKGIKNGTYKTIAQREEEKRNANSGLNGVKPPFYMLWKDEDNEDDNDEHRIANKRNLYHLPAPKMPLPGHAESYNPPPEYLLTTEEQEILEQTDASDRQYNFIPKQFNSLRHVSGYKNFILERFERCLDLYLCPRKLKLRLNIDPESLVPRLPKPRELKPFPNTLCLQYLGHTKAVKCISVSADGQYLVSGSDDCTVRLWEVDTCLCRYIWTFPTPVNQVQWNPSVSHHVIAVATGKSVVFINTGTGDRDSTELSDSLFDTIRNNNSNTNNDENDEEDAVNDSDSDDEDNSKNTKKSKKIQAVWKVLSTPSSTTATDNNNNNNNNNTQQQPQQYKYGYPIGPVAELSFPHTVLIVQWHYKGDYLSSVQAADAGATAVCIHLLSKGNTQRPFSKSPGIVQAVKFHPSRPFLFVVTQQHVKIYHLVEQKLMKKLMSGCKWLSSIDVHPSGDHIVLGSYDRRMLWFDLDLSSTPYKTLKYHEKAVRHVAIHRRYPLMVSASDDGSVHVFHSTVYSDLSRSPLIVPLKVLKGHGVIGGVGVLCTAFHPRQPWLFTSGADSVINLFQDI